ncbi:MAG: type II toxin-antitoxin system prevent-host-death family antitoxin [Firmicutes bacterium]|nr:type II toxin-antitoxin system prevent-host-death family antitoxin [Bacillota bacterium]MBR6025285.1 type II toxin-antitoxin system prevent-host-death family antitoxin [Bacillota bacterium]
MTSFTKATTTEVQNNFGHYLKEAQEGKEIIIFKNGKEVAKLISYEKSLEYLTDSLKGILKNNYDEKAIWKERMKKYESTY